jgi:hypothetical protein
MLLYCQAKLVSKIYNLLWRVICIENQYSGLCVNPWTTSLDLYLTTTLFSIHSRMKTLCTHKKGIWGVSFIASNSSFLVSKTISVYNATSSSKSDKALYLGLIKWVTWNIVYNLFREVCVTTCSLYMI